MAAYLFSIAFTSDDLPVPRCAREQDVIGGMAQHELMGILVYEVFLSLDAM